jgi:hypothetical protein
MNPKPLSLPDGTFHLAAAGEGCGRRIVISAIADVALLSDISDRILHDIGSVRFDLPMHT